MLNYEFPPIGGGAGKAHLAILKAFAQIDSLQVDVLTSGPKPKFSTERFAGNINIYKIGLHKKNLHYWRKIEVLEWLFKSKSRYQQMINENNYELVHSFFAFPSGWLCYKSREKLPYIVSLRGSDVPGYNVRLDLDYKLLGGLFRRIWSSASAVVANSQGLRKLAGQFTPELDIKVIPNGIDTDFFQPTKNKRPHHPFKLLTVCRLISRKRLDLLIQATDRLKEMGLEAELNIVGDGNLLRRLRGLADKLGVSDRVNFPGRIDPQNMPRVYRENDIFVMSSAHEGMSNAMLEAMASGLPIVTTECEGVEELVTDNGIIVKQPDGHNLAEAIAQLIGNRNIYDSMSSASRNRAGLFTWSVAAEKYINCYKEILTNRKS